MDKKLFGLVVLLLAAVVGCSTTGDKEGKYGAVAPDNCTDIPKLQWQVYSRGFDANSALELATRLTLAAKADAARSRSVAEGSVNADVGFASELSKVINLNVNQESKVSEKFWEQDLSYRQSLCYLDGLSKRDDLTPEQKDKSISEILALTTARREYMFQRDKRDIPVSVQYDRIADMSETRCEQGRRKYKNIVRDTLTFSESIKEYQAQAYTNDTGGEQTVEVSYMVNGKKVTPIPDISDAPQGTKRKLVRIPVDTDRLTVTYVYRQNPSPTDDEWGLSFVSSLNISSIHARVILPLGKEVGALNPKYETANSAFHGCSFTEGAQPILDCPNGVESSPNVPVYLVWQWNVFDGC